MKEIQTGIEMSLTFVYCNSWRLYTNGSGFSMSEFKSFCEKTCLAQPFATEGKKAIDFTDWFLAKS